MSERDTLAARLLRLADTIDSYCDHEDDDPMCLDSLHALSAQVRDEALAATPALATVNERDTLAALLHRLEVDCADNDVAFEMTYCLPRLHNELADRLIAAGVTLDATPALALDVERLARALDRVFPQPPWIGEPISNEAWRIAAAYAEDERIHE